MCTKINCPTQVPESHVPSLAHVKSYHCANLSAGNCLPCFTFENSQYARFFIIRDTTANKVSNYELENRGSIPGQLKVILL
jgi:hypothetical protein